MCFVFLGVLCPTTCMFTASCIRKKRPHSCLRPRHELFWGTFSSGDTSANTPAAAVGGAAASSLTQGLREFMEAEQLCVGLDHCPYVNMISLFRRWCRQRTASRLTPLTPVLCLFVFIRNAHSVDAARCSHLVLVVMHNPHNPHCCSCCCCCCADVVLRVAVLQQCSD